jgi:dTDP-glucose 4,6-dehydratase
MAIKSYLHIKDVCAGILLALKLGSLGEIYHFSPDESISIRELVAKICLMFGCDFERYVQDVEDRPGQDASYIIDSSRARRELKWLPTINLTQGLSEVAWWINSEYPRLKYQPLDYVHQP